MYAKHNRRRVTEDSVHCFYSITILLASLFIWLYTLNNLATIRSCALFYEWKFPLSAQNTQCNYAILLNTQSPSCFYAPFIVCLCYLSNFNSLALEFIYFMHTPCSNILRHVWEVEMDISFWNLMKNQSARVFAFFRLSAFRKLYLNCP